MIKASLCIDPDDGEKLHWRASTSTTHGWTEKGQDGLMITAAAYHKSQAFCYPPSQQKFAILHHKQLAS